MQISTKLDYRIVPRGEAATLRLLVTFTPEPRDHQARLSLNLAVVLDRSGSMQGDKLGCVSEASRQLVRALAPGDLVSLTVFDHRVEELVAPTDAATGRETLIAAIDAIESGGSTDLHAGYTHGAGLALRAAGDARLSRVILLTDGMANQGTTDPELIAACADHLRTGGVGTSTIGVGGGYNEELLGRIAERGGGSTYFIREPREAPAVFAEELGDLFAVDARDVEVTFVPAGEGIAVEQLNTYTYEGAMRWRLGDVYGAAPRSIVLELRTPAFDVAAGTEISLGTVSIAFGRPGEGGFTPYTSELPVSLVLGTREEAEAAEANRDVTLQAAYLVAARAIARAMGFADAGRYDEAAEQLEACARGLESLRLADALLAERLADLQERAHRLRSERTDYYRPLERKQMYAESEYGTKGHLVKMLAMQNRRRTREVYPCYFVNGHILAEIGTDRLLVDTGAVASLGTTGTVDLAGLRHPTVSSFMGASITDIGRLVGTMVSIVLGADVLDRCDLRVDLDRGEFQISAGELPLQPLVIVMEAYQGVPIVTARVDGRDERFFLDTGAKLSYLHSSLADGWAPAGTDTDFFLGFGEFTADTGTKTIELGGRTRTFRFATLPQILEASLGLAGVRGILGSALCEGSVLTIAARRGLVSVA